MQLEGMTPTGQNAAANAIAAENSLKQIKQLQFAVWTNVSGERVPIGAAIRGFSLAIALALSFWVVVGLLLWLILR